MSLNLNFLKTPLSGIRHLAILLALCPLVCAQWNATPSLRRDSSPSNAQSLSDLARENLNYVAASSDQIRTVLAKDAGLLVELKRWIAKEATDNGQVVQESKLTDQAISDRLDRDTAFRAVATRLLQRYGYLLPAPNPDSDFAKEQEFVLKERARRLVAIEAQEDAESLQPDRRNQGGSDVERTDTCDVRQDPTCPQTQNRKPRPRSSAGYDSLDNSPKTTPDLPEIPPSPTLRARIEGQTEQPSEATSSAEFELASKSAADIPIPLQIPESFPSNGTASARTGLDYLERSDARIPMPGGGPHSQPVPTPEFAERNEPNPRRAEGDVPPVKMVRPANPYADIPSLYDMYVQASAVPRPAQRFGLDVFRNTASEPDVIPIDLPVGPDYVVGTGDSLSIDLWGSVSQRLVRLIDREGRISLPEIGPLFVSGKNLADIQQDVQRALRAAFRDVSADVSLSRVRTVRVYVVGDVAEPGAYDISSLSTPLNALFAAGGVTARGSLRTLRHSRGKQLIEQVDAYDLLLHGIRSDLRRLEDGDTLLVPPLGPQVTVEGMVRRPGIYELLDEKSLSDVLALAGGILPTAALRHVEVQRVEAHEKRTMLTLDLASDNPHDRVDKQLDAFQVQDGDQIHIFPIAAYNEDAIYLQGHVLRPGRYSFKPGMKVTDLITSYSDLLPEPAPHYAEIVRLNPPDFHPSVESFDISEALANPASAPLLNRLDTVRIFSRYDFERPPDVTVVGEVRAPGNYRTSGEAHLRDAVYLAGGLTPDAALDSAQLFRTQADGSLKILSVSLREALAGNPIDNIVMQSRDRLLVHKTFERVDAPTVNITGEVAKPGRYPLTGNMHVADLIRVAGGLKRSAFADDADLTRFAVGGSASQRLDVKLAAAMSGDANEDIPLHNGDVLAIRQLPQWNDLGASVTVRGEVQHPATYGIQPGERLSSLLMRCNGFTPEAYPYGAVLIRREVRELEMRSHLELVNRIKSEETYLKTLPEGDVDQKNGKLQAITQTETALQQLEATPPAGRLVIHIPSDMRKLARSADDVPLRDGDELLIPKKTNYIVVSGQVFHPTAVSFQPGRSAKWYLGQSGGLTQIADKDAVFVIRADGSVLSAKNNSGLWLGDPLNAVLKPGDSIVVPEKAPKVATRNIAPLLQAAQVASSLALTVAYIHP
ncbi:MAG TPA: SLBB domain-containing protein [Terriglobales bacterium]|nr:SLBB domain-containing protein [Terriglobales bacterium]